ncbi:hypothetical protein Tsubulata_046518 [Turnera subulata]|uniref:Uncharacterized protein n=1 Tax=Turnera subulata TaxID=218843 RepID=A0A9Q0GHT3_9ROSI|nr:hypothetical protein Tsubulata_046518 [Turnera subulata]
MDNAPSWADQWDYQNPDPVSDSSEKDKKKEKKSHKNPFGKKILSLKWMKDLGKKSDKEQKH